MLYYDHSLMDIYTNSCFYMITKKYECAGKPSHESNGYDKDIISQLPEHLQDEFPAILTHRSGISKKLAKIQRILIQNSIGPSKLSKILRELHVLKFDNLQHQYLRAALYYKSNTNLTRGVSNDIQDFCKFDDPNGYAGHVPSANFLSYVYTTVLSSFKPAMDRQTSMLSGEILKGDHSFKLIKKIAKLGSESIFSALYTVCNEYSMRRSN